MYCTVHCTHTCSSWQVASVYRIVKTVIFSQPFGQDTNGLELVNDGGQCFPIGRQQQEPVSCSAILIAGVWMKEAVRVALVEYFAKNIIEKEFLGLQK